MLVFKLLAINSNNNGNKKNNITTSISIVSNFDSYNINDDDGCPFYHAVKQTYDQRIRLFLIKESSQAPTTKDLIHMLAISDLFYTYVVSFPKSFKLLRT
jgi:hypothetical protein